MRSWTSPEVPRVPGPGLPLRLYDTATGEVRATSPGPTASMYVCGITPYDATHVGHAATYLAMDLIVRAWRDAGHEVRYAQNVTDVDDPLLERAVADGEDWQILAERETQVFRDDMAALRVIPPDHYIGAVESIPDIAEMIQNLRGNGAAYQVGDDLYFPISADPRFGGVAGLDRAAMLARFIEFGGDPHTPGKRDPLDPLLWQAERTGDPAWRTDLGWGRPGWHVECAAIATEFLGLPVDVQGGGRDLVFPHHEMSSAMAEVSQGTWPFARQYVHAGMVGYQGHKMSKSRGNLVFIRDLRSGDVDPGAIRLAILRHHYREDWEWQPADLSEAADLLAGWRAAARTTAGPAAGPVIARMRQCLSDDLDAPGAIRAVSRWAADTRSGLGSDEDAPGQIRSAVDGLLGVSV